MAMFLFQDLRHAIDLQLSQAHAVPYLGDAAKIFVEFLVKSDTDEQRNGPKGVVVAQSSGMGKSRMLTETGKMIFTLPICLRKPGGSGFPPSDEAAYKYFNTHIDDYSKTGAYSSMASFFAALYSTMLARLQDEQKRQGCDGPALLAWWNESMETYQNRSYRDAFFVDVIEQARSIDRITTDDWSALKTFSDLPDRVARYFYHRHAQAATSKLVDFIKTLGGGIPALCVTYFDSVDDLSSRSSIISRLISHQDQSTPMWYVFLMNYPYPPGTELPFPRYFALGFDQHAIAHAASSKRKTVTMGELQSIEHLCSYGRPMWHALFTVVQKEAAESASLKLTCAKTFYPWNPRQVLAVLSHRLGIELVPQDTSEARELANESVARHMRLLTGISPDGRIYDTHAPSEPILTRGAVELLYAEPGHWPEVLDTFIKDLCQPGLVNTGVAGEFSARTLLLLSRDFATPKMEYIKIPDILKPISVMAFLDELFRKEMWSELEHREQFESAFKDATVNFSHWMISEDNLPKTVNRKILANLWARHAALQCPFDLDAAHLLIPIYLGSVADDAIFDPEKLSSIVVHVQKYTVGDGKDRRPRRWIAADLDVPLPCISFLMELGSQDIGGCHDVKVELIAPSWAGDDLAFRRLARDWAKAVDDHANSSGTASQRKALRSDVEAKRVAKEDFNKFTISAQGVFGLYGILDKAGVAGVFEKLLGVTMLLGDGDLDAKRHMRPFEFLEDGLAQGDSMLDFDVQEDEPNVHMDA